MKLNKLRVIGWLCVYIGLVFPARGSYLWNEDFSYSDGPLTNANWQIVISEYEGQPSGTVTVTNGLCSLARVVSSNGVQGTITMCADMGDVLGYAPAVLRNNAKSVSWGIQIPDTQFNPGTGYSTTFQYAYVLAASSTNFLMEGVGYFIGTDGTDGDDFLYLGKFSNGLQDGYIESIIHTEFELGWNAAYDSASIRVDYDPVSSVWRLYADRSSGIEPLTLSNLVGTIQADSSYTDSSLPFLGLMFNYREHSATYDRSLNVNSLSIWASSQQTVPRIPGSDGGGVEYDYFIDLVEVRVSDYVNFLNQAQITQGLAVQNGIVTSTNGDAYCLTADGETSSYIEYDDSQGLSQRFSAVTGKEDHPMVFVSWFGAAAYCNWKSQSEGLEPVYDAANGWSVTTNRGYRLPTEAEWRKAAAWQPESATYALYGTASNTIKSTEANFLASGDAFETNTVRTTPVSSYSSASAYALRDAGGNVWEWCHDFFDAGQTDTETSPRVIRGGGWGNLSKDITTEVRNGSKSGQMNNSTGFRTAIPVE